jgi:hypothetical protein
MGKYQHVSHGIFYAAPDGKYYIGANSIRHHLKQSSDIIDYPANKYRRKLPLDLDIQTKKLPHLKDSFFYILYFNISTPARPCLPAGLVGFNTSTFQYFNFSTVRHSGLKSCTCHDLQNKSKDSQRNDQDDSSDKDEHDRLYHFRQTRDHVI